MMRKLGLFIIVSVSFALLSCTTGGGTSSAPEDEVLSLDESPSDNTAASSNDTGEDALEKELDLNESGQEQAAEDQNAEQPQELKAQAETEPEPSLQPQEEVPPPVVAEPKSISTSAADINNISYLANQNGGTVVIEASGPLSYQVRKKPETSQVVIEIQGANLPGRLKRPYILKEFDAAFAAINAYQNPGSTTARVVIQLRPGDTSEPVVQQEGNSIVVIPGSPAASAVAENKPDTPNSEEPDQAQISDVKAADADEKALAAKTLDEFLSGSNKFYGRKISVEVTDQDIRDVLDFIGREVGLNLIMSEDVQGKVSMKLRNIPWDQALITIMKAKKLGYVRQGTVVRISTLASLQEENDAAKKILDSQKILSPLRVKVIPVSFAAVEDLAKQIPPFLTQNRGQIVVDARTSSLIVTDTEDILERVSRLVKQLDIPPAQVMIEGKVIEAQSTFSQTLGVNWMLSGVTTTLAEGRGNAGADLVIRPALAINNLPAGTTGPLTLGLNVGRFDVIGDINAALTLAEVDSQIKILSSPRVVTINKEKAHIEQKGQVVSPQSIRDAQGQITSTAVRTDYTLDLSVTPQITAEGSVIMDVEVKREFPGSIDITTKAAPINSRSAKTKILVNDGQTAVLGGIYSSDNQKIENGVPWLRHIPVLGWLFKSKSVNDTKNELLIFLTPKILNVRDQSAEG